MAPAHEVLDAARSIMNQMYAKATDAGEPGSISLENNCLAAIALAEEQMHISPGHTGLDRRWVLMRLMDIVHHVHHELNRGRWDWAYAKF